MPYDDMPATSETASLFSHFRHKKLGISGAPRAVMGTVFPSAPLSFGDLGVGPSLLNKLILKHLLVGGALRNDELAQRLAIPLSLLDEPTTFLRKEMMVEARGEGSAGISGVMRLNLTERGYQRARAYLEEN
ncbi:hypothetical protein [Thiofaba sp. EF100]|uniref:hypothetical protein n=1 Tax=Thiofaba sp. EF100 TaxID=3121274 RepID=UPI0032217F7A